MRRIQSALGTIATIGLALVFAASALAAPTDAAAPLAGPGLVDALRHGGYVIYFRHTSTDFGQNDEGMTSFEDCSTQRNLTEQGRAEARAIGVEMARLQLPVGKVLASPFCRTRETATLIFGRATTEPRARGGPAQADRYGPLRELLSTPVPTGEDTVIVGHGNPFAALAGPPYLAEGEAAVIAPLDAGNFRVVARVKKDEWKTL